MEQILKKNADAFNLNKTLKKMYKIIQIYLVNINQYKIIINIRDSKQLTLNNFFQKEKKYQPV
jgi:predicted nuclease of predicted toxin-antitoxin system